MKYINQMHAHAYILTCLFHLSTLGMISKLQSKIRHLLVCCSKSLLRLYRKTGIA